MAGDNRSCSSLFRRAEQLKRWEESETNNEIVNENVKKRKVKFSDGCIFLAAAAAGDKDELHKLLDRGADINTVNQDGIAALHAACIDNNMEIVEFLVDNGADINRCDMEGWTPLHATASCGSRTMAKFLIDRGADLSVVNNDGELAIDVIEEDDMGRLLQEEMVIRGVDCDASRSREERSMLEDAQCWLGQGQITEKPHHKTGATALHVAAAKGYIRVVRLLIQAGADINAKDFDGWTSLHAAVHWGQTEAVEILCDSMANMDLLNYVGQTPYDLADDGLKPLLDELKRKQASIKLITQNKISSKKQRLSVHPDRSRNKDSSKYGSDGTSSDESSGSVERKPSAPADQSEIQSWRRPSLRNRKVEEKITDLKEVSTSVSFNSNEEKHELNKNDRYCIDVPKVTETSDPSSVTTTTVLSPSRPINRSFVGPSRDEESETQRKAHAKMVRSTRRSTQGITLEDVRSAEQLMKAKQDPAPNSVNIDTTEPPSFSLEDVRSKNIPKEEENSIECNSYGKLIEDRRDKPEEKTSTTREGTQAVIHRKKKAKRRSTGVVHVDMDEIDPDRQKDSLKDEGELSVSEKEEKESGKSRKGSAENGDIDYKKLYEEQLTENDRLMNRLRSYEKELRQARETLSTNNKVASTRNAAAESERREKRALERKLSEMEEELRELEQLRQENQRLRDENGALIRVISKLSR